MPGMNGLQLLEQLRDENNDIPFVMFTGRGREEVAIRALNLGADYYLRKGGDPKSQYTELSHVINKVVNHKLAEQALSRSERELQESEERYRVMVEQMQEGVVVEDSDGRITFVNPELMMILGYSKEEILGKHIHKFVHPQSLGKIRKESAKRPKGISSTYEINLISKEGRPIPVILSATPLFTAEGDFRGVLSVSFDISIRKQMEKLVQISSKFLHITNRHIEMQPLLNEFVVELLSFTDCSAVGIRILDEDGNIPYEEFKGFSQIFYESESPLTIKSDYCMCIDVIKGDIDPAKSFFTKFGSFFMNYTTKFLATVSEEEKGQTRNVCNAFGYESMALIPIRVGDKILGLVHVADFRENRVPLETVEMLENVVVQLGTAIQRVWTNETQRESEEKFRSLFEHANDSIFIIDPTARRFLDVNENAARRLGYTKDELLQLTMDDIYLPLDEELRKKLRKELEENGSIIFERTHLHKNGREIPVEVNAHNVEYSGQKVIQSFIRDIAERKKVEEFLKRQKEELSEFAHAMAHDLGNSLTSILGFAEILERKYNEPYVKRIHQVALRMNELLGRSLELADAGLVIDKTDNVDLNLVMKEMNGTIIPESITLSYENLPKLLCDEKKVSQIFKNIFENAIIHGEPKKIQITNKNSDKGKTIIISNDGKPIPKKYHSEVFRRGFTTRKKSRGIGLAIVKRLIEAHGWQISLDSTPETTFRIFIPNK